MHPPKPRPTTHKPHISAETLSDNIPDQLRRQGFTAKHALEYDADRVAINRLYIRAYITERHANILRRKLVQRITKAAKPTEGSQP